MCGVSRASKSSTSVSSIRDYHKPVDPGSLVCEYACVCVKTVEISSSLW